MASQGGYLLLGEWIGPCAPGERGGLWVRKDCLCADLPTSVAVCLWALLASLALAKASRRGSLHPGLLSAVELRGPSFISAKGEQDTLFGGTLC